MFDSMRRRAIPIAVACTISTAAIAVLIHQAHGQEAGSDLPAPNVQPDVQPDVQADPSQQPTLPEVKIIQSNQDEAATESQPKAKPKKQPRANSNSVAVTPKKKATQAAQPAPLPPRPTLAQAAETRPTPVASAAALGFFNPALDLDGLELPPGTTLTTAGPVDGYRALSAMSSTKTATPIEQIPQSIQVVPKKLLDDQKNITVSEAVTNVSNVQGPNSHSLGDTQLYPYTIRGFGAQAWLDGMVLPFSLGDRDAFANVERIEVLKGPAAILYGGGAGAPIGGAINIVSKLPTDRASGEFGFTFGSRDFLQPYFDVNQPLSSDGTVLFRVTGEYTAADSFINVLEQDRYSINPTLTLTDKTDTTLTIQGRWSKSMQQTYQGLPATGTIQGSFRIDPDLFIGLSDIPRGYSEVKGVTVTLDRRLNDIWSANVKARWSKGSFEQNTQLAVGGDPANATPAIPPSTWLLANVVLHQDIEEFSVNPNAKARFTLGESENTVLVGADYSRVHDDGIFLADYLGSSCAAFFGFGGCGFSGPTVDLLNPSFTVPYVDPRTVTQYQDPFFGFDQVVNFGETANIYTTKGAYIQLQSTLYDSVHVLVGVRSSSIDIEQTERALGFPQVTTIDAHKILPRAGLLVDVLPWLSVYGSYSEGMRAIPRQLPTGKSEPEFSEQREVGFKFNLGNQLSGTVAYFEIDRDNVIVNLGLGNTALAAQRAHGAEADILWQPDNNWQLLASYGYTNAEFADGLLGVTAGRRFPIVPEHSGRVWLNYTFDDALLRGWSVGAGVYAASSQFIDAANLYKVPGYFTVDAKIGYESEDFRAAFHVKNLTGEEGFLPYAFLGGQVVPIDDRAYYGTIVYKY